jgi:hypothetical protein
MIFIDANTILSNTGVFIPVTDFYGITANELSNSTSPETLEGKVLTGVLTTLVGKTQGLFILGFPEISKVSPSGTTPNTMAQTFSVVIQSIVEVDNRAWSLIPLPFFGANAGVGGIAIRDIFPNAVLVSIANTVTSASKGILFEESFLNYFGAFQLPGSINSGNDNRDLLYGLLNYFYGVFSVRSAATASAILSKVKGAVTSVTLPVTYTDATNPISGINSANLAIYDIYSRRVSFTVEYLLDDQTQTYDVNVALS